MDSQTPTGHLDRCGDERLDDGLLSTLWADPRVRVVDWSADGALIEAGAAGSMRLALDPPRPETLPQGESLTIFLGRDDTGVPWLAHVAHPAEHDQSHGSADAHTDADATDSSIRRLGLRDIGHDLPELHQEAFMTTQALASWHRTHRRCPRCGEPTVPTQSGWVRRCDADGSEHYPRTDPAVIMAITDSDDRLLLARAPAWPENRRSVLAGFVEPGERLEAAVAREVAEEVGLRIDDIRYVGSQPWPFPASLMLGFTARTGDPRLTIDDAEIVAAEWYTRESLRDAVASGTLGLPGRLSIARRLIEGWYGQPLTPPREVAFHRHDNPDSPLGNEAPSSGR